MSCVRRRPCPTCPYRRDVPSGVWAPSEYAKLPPYDAPTFAQPIESFGCHATPGQLCHGWVYVHSSRGHEFDLLALRLHWPEGGIPEPVCEPVVHLFGSGAEAAAHGLADIDDPSPEAHETVSKLVRIVAKRQDRSGASGP